MKKHPKLFLCVIISVLFASPLWAVDFGLLLDLNQGFGGTPSYSELDYTGSVIPWFSALIGDIGEFTASAGFKADYQEETDIFLDYQDKTHTFVPELLRTELSMRFGAGAIRAGRMQYSDPLGFIADGLFDGVIFYQDTELGTFSSGALYTGLLYKKRASVAMTDDELKSNYTALDYDNFTDTYFAPRRFLLALGWEHPGLKELLKTNVALLGQFDFSGKDIVLNTQYLAARITLPVNAFVFDIGGSLEFIQQNKELGFALAGEIGATWALPTALASQLSLSGRYSSGAVEDSSIRAFLPVTTKSQGEILKAKLSGLSVLSLDYTARITNYFSAGISSSYFVGSALNTFMSSYDTESALLGNEFFGRAVWSPASDIMVNLGGGIFMPFLGNAAPDAPNLWRMELNVVISLY
jgi:hypothetical protein